MGPKKKRMLSLGIEPSPRELQSLMLTHYTMTTTQRITLSDKFCGMEHNSERLQLISALYQKNREAYPDIRHFHKVDDLNGRLWCIDKVLKKTEPCIFKTEIKLEKKLIQAKLEIYSPHCYWGMNGCRTQLQSYDFIGGEEEEEEREEKMRLSTEILLNYLSRYYTNEKLKEILLK